MIKLLPPETLAWLRLAASCGQPDAQLTLHILERLEALEKRPIPTPEAPPVATDEVQPLPPHIAITYQPKSVYQPLRPTPQIPCLNHHQRSRELKQKLRLLRKNVKLSFTCRLPAQFSSLV
jgi:hypothetical protein